MDLWEAAYRGDLERVRAIIEQDAEPLQAQNASNGTTLLLHAADGGHVGVVRYLLDAGADMDRRAHNGSTVLHVACKGGHAGVASLLLQRGADVTAVTHSGSTALAHAAMHGRDAIVRVLLEHGGSDVDAVTNYGETALHRACWEGHAAVVRQLLEAGADVTLRDAHGRTALDLAAHHGRPNCVKVIQEWDLAYLVQRARRLRDASTTPSTNTSHQGS